MTTMVSPTRDRPTWATEIVSGTSRFRLFAPRPNHAAELLRSAAGWSDRTAMVHGEDRRTFAEFFDRCGAVAEELRRQGVGRRDRVAVLGRNTPTWLEAFWAAELIDAIPVLLNAWWTERELRHLLDLAAPALVVTDEEFAPRLPLEVQAVTTEQLAELPTGRGAQLGSSSAHEDDTAVVVCTSGTTSLPKGVELSHRSLVATQLHLLAVAGRIPGTYDDETRRAPVSIIAGPLFHMAGLQLHLATWLVGGAVVLLPGRFDPREAIETMACEGVTAFNGVPTMMARILDVDPATVPEVTSLRSVGLGGAPVPPALVEQVAERFPTVRRRVSNSYGMTETGGGVAASSGADAAARPGTSGRPFPLVDLRIDDQNADGVGEVCVRSPGQMTGYLGSDETPIDAEGWLHTGDLGYLDDDGYLYIVGRSKDVIIRGGENIAAAVVEAALGGHPTVAEAAAVALPDADLGEVIGAVVVPRTGARFDLEDLAAHARAQLAYFEVPARWWVHAGPLPTNEPGKVDKSALAAAFPVEGNHQ